MFAEAGRGTNFFNIFFLHGHHFRTKMSTCTVLEMLEICLTQYKCVFQHEYIFNRNTYCIKCFFFFFFFFFFFLVFFFFFFFFLFVSCV